MRVTRRQVVATSAAAALLAGLPARWTGGAWGDAARALTRERLTLGKNQATHMLLGIPYAATMGLQGSPVKPMIIPMYLNRNGQAITLTKALLEKGVKTPQQLKPLAFEAQAQG